ncbi:MAG: ATP-binding protein [Candidatus Omnitrophota bacterium]
MNLDLKEILAKGENDRVEFKKSFSEEKEIIETIGAFLNHKGGIVVIGYDEQKGNIIEQDIGKETIQKFINKVKSVTTPQVIVDTYETEYKNKKLIIVDVMEYPIKPVAIHGRYYRRRMNSNHILTPGEISNLHLFTLNSSWDYQIAQNSTLKDIDMETVDWFIEKLTQQKRKKIADHPLKVLERYELIRENKPTFAALLLFPKNPSFILDVQIGLYENEITVKKDKNIKKSVLLEVDDIMDFITAYITKEFIITGKPQREERWQYPLDAIREVAMNSVIHRDYQEGTHTQIKIFREKLTFWNSGRLPMDLSISDLKSGAVQSKPRNRLLAQIFKELGIIEKYGDGIKRVIENFKTYGLTEPHFEEKAGGFYVTINDKSISYNHDFYNSQQYIRSPLPWEIPDYLFTHPDNRNYTQKSVEKNQSGNEKETGLKILKLLKHNPALSRSKIAEAIGISESGVKYHLEKFRKAKKIVHVGSTKGGYWKIL